MDNITMKEMSPNDLPMERLIRFGKENLTEDELLAILLGSGTAKRNVLQLAHEILMRFRGGALLRATAKELMEEDGVGKTKATRIMAALELGKRLYAKETFERVRFNEPDTVAEYFYQYFLFDEKEKFCVVLLDTKNQPISTELISIGTLNSSLVHPREVFRPAIQKNANSVILAHNHPSGDPAPSKEDIVITKRLEEVGKVVGILVLDHIVVGRNRYISFREKNLL